MPEVLAVKLSWPAVNLSGARTVKLSLGCTDNLSLEVGVIVSGAPAVKLSVARPVNMSRDPPVVVIWAR